MTPRRSPYPPRTFFQSVVGHVLGAGVALALALAYDLHFWLDIRGAEVALDGPAPWIAAVHLYGLSFPIVLVVGVAFGALDAWLYRPEARRLLDARHAFEPQPVGVAAAVSALVVAVVAFFLLRAIAVYAELQFHSREVVQVFVAALSLPLLVFAPFAFRWTSRALAKFATKMDLAASPVALLAIALEVAYAARFRFAELSPAIDRSIPWYSVIAAAIFCITTPVAGQTLAPRRHFPGARRTFTAFVLLSTFGTFTTVVTYGETSSHRFIVEEVSTVGARLHRIASEVLDRDGDGYPALLGGGDCDDSRSDVHPGAVDERGDRLDADCFGGDGTPPFDDRGSGSHVLPRDGRARPNILFISVDTMRADRLRRLGGTRTVAPNLDAFSRQATVFRSATASSPRTTRSIPSVFTGQHPGRIRYERALGTIDITRDNETLAERLDEQYTCATVLGTSYFRTAPGMLQGFGSVDQPLAMKPSPDWPTDRALAWVDRMAESERPHFVWVHFFSPHEPYLIDGFPSRFGNTPKDHYDTEIWRADEQIGRILDRVTQRSLWNDTVVVVFSDHGESLGEHGGHGHSTRLDQEQTQSVLMVRAPGSRQGIVDHPVALFDIFSTALDYAGIEPTESVSSLSLVRAINGDSSMLRGRPVFSEILPDSVFAIEAQSIRMDALKLVYYPLAGRFRLFDITRDPREFHDLSEVRRGDANRLLGILYAWNVSSHIPENRVAARVREAIVERIPPDATPLDARFSNGIRIVGAKVWDVRAARESDLRVDVYFETDRPITTPYYIHTVFEGADPAQPAGRFEAHHTAVDGNYPTTNWRVGEIIRDHVSVKVPAHLVPGVPMAVRVELWSQFHLRTPVTVVENGRSAPSVEVGRFVVE